MRVVLAAAAAVSLVAAAANAASIVSFDVSTVAVTGSYQSMQRTAAISTTSEYRTDFDTATPLFAGYPNLYGGAHIVNSAAGGTISSWRLHDNNPTGWPNKPTLFLMSNDGSGGASHNNVNLLYLFKKAGFAGDAATSTVSFDSTSTLSVNIQDWGGSVSGGRAAEIRFLVQDGSQYYVSETRRTSAGLLTLADFDNNPTVGQRWAPVTLTAANFDLPVATSLTFAAKDFTDVQAVGFIGAGSRQYLTTWGFNTYSAEGLVPEPAMLGIAGIVVPALLMRRRSDGSRRYMHGV